MTDKVFVVVALHDTGHGEDATPLLVTPDIVAAVDAARDAEKAGYEFYGNDTMVCVYSLEPGRVYSKRDHKGQTGLSDTDLPCVFVRRRILWKDGLRQPYWNEDWYSDEAAAEYLRCYAVRRSKPKKPGR